MENTEFPIVIKRRNGVMIGVVISEILVGLIFALTQGGIKSILLWVFLFVAVITALSVWVEYKQDVLLKENKIEFYSRDNLIKSIEYSSIKTISIEKGKETKNKKKDFFTLGFVGKKGSRIESYEINPMNYGVGDIRKIKDIIVMKNSSVKVSDEAKKLTR